MERTTGSSLSLEEILKRKSRDTQHESVPTSIGGISMRRLVGKDPKLNKATMRSLASKGRSYFRRKMHINALTKQQEAPDAFIKELARTHDGLRGIESTNGSFGLTVSPSYELSNWDGEKLREPLGLAYTSLVTEKLIIEVTPPLGRQTEEGPLTSEMARIRMYAGLIALLGVSSEEELSTIAESRVEYTVNEVGLGRRLLADKTLHLAEDTATIRETWRITTDQPKTT